MTFLFEFWIDTSWYIALLMSLATNLLVFFVAAYCIEWITNRWISDDGIFHLIDSGPLGKNQKQYEIKNGVISCLLFSLVSLSARELFEGVLPGSLKQLLIEVLAFTIFYETYSYFVHRLLHLKPFTQWHGVHHRSHRVTPWSAYSVHPIEALLICLSAPLFMLIFPVHLAVIFVFHILGVVFTMALHSNIILNKRIPLSSIFNAYTLCHAAHHKKGNVNFGFVNTFWDVRFKTIYPSKRQGDTGSPN